MADLTKLNLYAEGDYLEFRCDSCSRELDVEYLGFDTTVGRFRIGCSDCKTTRVWKVQPGRWSGLPAKPA